MAEERRVAGERIEAEVRARMYIYIDAFIHRYRYRYICLYIYIDVYIYLKSCGRRKHGGRGTRPYIYIDR